MTRCSWLAHRYLQLHDELITRNYNLNDAMYQSILIGIDSIPIEWCDWYEPDESAVLINRQRISERLN